MASIDSIWTIEMCLVVEAAFGITEDYCEEECY